MAYLLEVKEEAIVDTREAYFHYESKKYGLGDRFLAALKDCYKKIELNPQHYSHISADRENTLRDIKVKGFPYVVVFETRDFNAIVYAVVNCYRNR